MIERLTPWSLACSVYWRPSSMKMVHGRTANLIILSLACPVLPTWAMIYWPTYIALCNTTPFNHLRLHQLQHAVHTINILKVGDQIIVFTLLKSINKIIYVTWFPSDQQRLCINIIHPQYHADHKAFVRISFLQGASWKRFLSSPWFL